VLVATLARVQERITMGYCASIYASKNGTYNEVIPSVSRPTESEAIEHVITLFEGKRVNIERVSDIVHESPSGLSYAKNVDYSLHHEYGETPIFYTVCVYVFKHYATIDKNHQEYLQISREQINAIR